MSLEQLARRRPAAFAAAAFLWALALRAALLSVLVLHTGRHARELALIYDGHVYILIAKSFPTPYVGIEKIFPAYRDSSFFTGWFPLYPAAIAAVAALARDAAWSALLASQLLGSLAVALFSALARRVTTRPALATFLFAFFPPTWLLTGTLSFVEPAFLCCLIAAAERFLAGRDWEAAALAGLAAIAQKTGVLFVPVLLGAMARRGDLKARAPKYFLSLCGLAALAAYFAFVFRDPWAAARVQSQAFRSWPFQVPFASITEGLLAPTQPFDGHFWLRKALIASSCGFYLWALVGARAGRDPAARLLRVWLGVALLFHVSLKIYNLYGFYSFSRYLVMGAPAAVLLVARDGRLSSRWLWTAGAALIPLAFAVDAIEVSAAWDFVRRAWPAGYFESLASHL